ncbi:hypothetical protein GCM10009648_34440 [Tsukamurella spumae]
MTVMVPRRCAYAATSGFTRDADVKMELSKGSARSTGRRGCERKRSAATHSTVHANHGETATQRDGLITDAQMGLKTPRHDMNLAPLTSRRTSATVANGTQITSVGSRKTGCEAHTPLSRLDPMLS